MCLGKMAEAGLKAKGWHLTSEGLKELTQDGSNKLSVEKIIELLKDTDLRDVGEKRLPEEINRGKCEYIEGPLVLQIQKIRNVSAPKDNEESQTAPRMLRMTLTDGQLNCSAIEMEKLQNFGVNTAPGTKLCLKGTVEVENGFLLLTNKNTVNIGGRVEKLAENWELKKLLAKQSVTRANLEQEGGPPPFVPFGQRVRDSRSAPKPVKRDNFKSLQEKDKEKKSEDGEFQQQRQAVIAEALQAKEEGKFKTFGGGQKQIGQDREVSKIVEMGFSAEDASRALKEHNGNVNMAINMLISGGGQYQGSYNRDSRDRNFSKDDKRPPLREDKRENTRGRGRRRDQDDDGAVESVSSKPSGPATLFDFLETKIKPTAEDKGKTSNQNVPSSRNEQNSYKSNDFSKSANQNQQDRNRSQYNNKSDRSSNSYQNSGRGENSSRDYNRRDNRPQSGPAESSYSRQDSRKDTRQDQNSYNKDRNYNNDRRNPQQNFDNDRGKSENNTNSAGNRDSRNFQDQQRNQNRPKSSQVSNNRTQENRNENYNQGRNNDTYSGKSDNRQQNSYNNRSQGNRQSNSHQQSSYDNWESDSYSDNRSQGGSQGNRPKFNEGQQYSGQSYNQHQNRDSFNNKKFQKDTQEFHPESCPPMPNMSVPPPPLWRSGDNCLAKYWEDGKFYPVVITNLKPDLPTCIVRFTEYGNEEEVSFSDLRPHNKQMNNYSRPQGGQGQNRHQQYLPQSQHEQRLNTDNYSNYGDQRHGRGYAQGGANYDQNYASGRQGYDSNQITSMEFRRRRTEPNRPAQQLYQPPGRQPRDK